MVRRLIRAPVPPPNSPAQPDKYIVFAIKAMAQGTAEPNQQRRVLAWIIHDLCLATDNPYSRSGRDTAFACGKAFVGQQLLGLVNADANVLEKLE